MKYKALVTFTGNITKKKGDIFDLKDKEVAKDLLEAGFIEKAKNIDLDKEETVEDNSKETENED
jgi:hypothetical protein